MAIKYKTTKKHLLRAIDIVGDQSSLAKNIGRNQQYIWSLLYRASSIKADVAIAISKATGGKVTTEELICDFTNESEAK